MVKRYAFISLALLFSCEAQEVVPVSSSLATYDTQNNFAGPAPNIDLKIELDIDLANAQLLELTTPHQQPLVTTFNSALNMVSGVPEIRVLTAAFEQEVKASGLTTVEKGQLVELAAVVMVTADYLESGGLEEINKALAADLVRHGWLPADDPQIINASTKSGCNVNVRSVMAGAVVGFFGGGARGGFAGATVGTVAFPLIGTVTGAVSGAAVGAAVGFFGAVATGVAAELLLSCWSVPHLTKAVEDYKNLDPENFDPKKHVIKVLADGFKEA